MAAAVPIEIRMIRLIPLLTVLLIGAGCQSVPWARPAPPADPALPMSMSRNELVSYLNEQSGNLQAWQSRQVRMKVRMPDLPTAVTLKGSLACESPNHFHLTASNTFAHADLGANSERCWVYVKPGADGVVSWRHEDAALLEQLPTGIPYIDPDWLMEVLGVTPLETERFVISEGPGPNSRDLWLVASERTPAGRVLRRVIKVDTMRGVIREHAVYNDQDRVVVRASLSDHQPFNGHLIPRKVVLDFPSMDAELTLTFAKIETNPQIATSMWRVPSVPGADNIDVGQLVAAAQRQHREHRPSPQESLRSQSQAEERYASRLPEPDWDTPEEEPDWDTPTPTDSVQPIGYQPSATKNRRGWFRPWWKR